VCDWAGIISVCAQLSCRLSNGGDDRVMSGVAWGVRTKSRIESVTRRVFSVRACVCIVVCFRVGCMWQPAPKAEVFGKNMRESCRQRPRAWFSFTSAESSTVIMRFKRRKWVVGLASGREAGGVTRSCRVVASRPPQSNRYP